MTEIQAVYSDKGQLIHLHIDGYRTKGTRVVFNRDVATDDFPVTVCGVAAHVWWPGFPPKIPGKPTGRVWIPLGDALRLERGLEPGAVDPRHPNPSNRRWCPKCIGMALNHVGRGGQALDLLAEVIS